MLVVYSLSIWSNQAMYQEEDDDDDNFLVECLGIIYLKSLAHGHLRTGYYYHHYWYFLFFDIKIFTDQISVKMEGFWFIVSCLLAPKSCPIDMQRRMFCAIWCRAFKKTMHILKEKWSWYKKNNKWSGRNDRFHM